MKTYQVVVNGEDKGVHDNFGVVFIITNLQLDGFKVSYGAKDGVIYIKTAI
jgi:hypothetical protein